MEESLELRMQETIHDFADKPVAFSSGELDRKMYKGMSGNMGSYAQRDPKRHMLRLRTVGGQIDQTKLQFVADAVERFQIGRLKITTCQTLQLHDLPPESLAPLMEQALTYGIVTLGGGGDNPRSVMASPLSGVEPKEAFDVLPYAQAVSDDLVAHLLDLHLPRKLKIGFSNGPRNETHATFRDLGFVAQPDGTFRVYCAGGLGPNPKLGICVVEKLPASDILYCVDAMLDVFTTFGNYENRARARTRYLQETLGPERLQAEFQKALKKARSFSRTFIPSTFPIAKEPDGQIRAQRVLPQKQKGLYTVCYHPTGGYLPVTLPRRLHKALSQMEQTQVRLGPDGTLYVINLTGREVPEILQLTQGGANTCFESSVSCVGASVCQQGIRDSQGLLAAMLEAVRPYHFQDGVLPQVRISGCPSSCGCHSIAGLGFAGSVKLVDKVAHPAFSVFAGGNELQLQECLGEKLGVMLERDIPAFMIRLGQLIQAENTTFERWFPSHRKQLIDLASEFFV